MKRFQIEAGIGFLALCALKLVAATHYVDWNSTNSVAPYTNWNTAAANIQDAVDAAADGDLILVTNGIYMAGGRPVNGYALTNRVVVDKPVTVQSVNGPTETAIQGYQMPGTSLGAGSNAVRCVYLTNGATLVGFTLANGDTFDSGDAFNEQSGGGAWCEPGAVVRNSILHGNAASANGGGDVGGTLYNCELIDNSAAYGGGAYGSELFNCTVVNNHATSRSLGAGTAVCTNFNCIVEYNTYAFPANYSQCLFFWSCTTPMPANGAGNITNSPDFVDLPGGILRLRCGSPGIDAGTNLSGLFADDLRGEPRPVDGDGNGFAQFDMGAYERNPADDARDISIRSSFTNFALYFSVPFVAQIDGCASNFWWDFGDGTMVSNQFEVAHAWTNPGTYPVILKAQFPMSGLTGAATAMVDVVEAAYCVNASNSSPAYPFTTWATAATNIQDAVDAGNALGRLVLVTNGLYRYGGVALFGIMTNRVALTNGVRLQSINGPEYTIIEGASAPGGGAGDGAVRCLYVDQHSVVSGFTLTHGYTLASSVVDVQLHDGGGLNCESGALVTNCWVLQNFADYSGGGAYQGTFSNCRFSQNSAYYGGGASDATLVDCLVVSNSTYSAAGGGAHNCTLSNSTVSGNSSPIGGGGINGGVAYNCIVYGNSPNWGSWSASDPLFFHCCTTPLPGGSHNLTNEPAFVNPANGDFHLQSNSPCINSGNNSYVTSATDLDGNPRIAGGTVDIGAYEYQTPASQISYAWLQQYGLPINTNTDTGNPDRDGLNNFQEWIAGTDPTNASSTLWMFSPTNGTTGLVLSWQSVSGKSYWIQRATDLSAQAPFSTIVSNLYIYSSTGTYTDTTATNGGPYFYRVAVQQ